MNTEHFSAKTSFLILLIILLGSTLVIPARWLGLKQVPRKQINLGDDLTPISLLKEDSDKNNSPDWRDMAIASLGTTTKKVMSEAKVNPKIEKTLTDPNNLTASFSKNMYTASAYLQKNGGVSKAEQEQLINSIIAQEAEKITVTKYTPADLVIAKTDTSEDKRKYGNAMGAFMQKATTYKMGSGDVELIEGYMVNKDPTLVNAFVVKRGRLDEIIKDLLKTPVPYSVIPQHLVMLNAISEYRTILDSFAKIETDPIRTTISFNNYLPAVKAFLNTLTGLALYFKGEGILFTEKESGYIFTRGYIN
jgi:hypothetical protein